MHKRFVEHNKHSLSGIPVYGKQLSRLDESTYIASHPRQRCN